MQQVASDLLLLTTNLSQIKNRDRLIQLFIESIHSIFSGYHFDWSTDADEYSEYTLPVCTLRSIYGTIAYDNKLIEDQKQYAFFQNAVQLLAVLIERIEQDELLNNQKAHLQHLVDQQTNHLIQKQDELNEMNEEFSTMNEELVETNTSLLEVNLQLQNEMIKREKVEKKLQDSDKFFNHSNDMLCIAGFDGYFKILNPSWSKNLGWSTEELLSNPWIHYVHPDDIESTNNVKSTIVNGEELYLFENRYICKDGSIKWLSWSSFPHKQEKIMFGVARDVTSAKEAEKRLKQIEWMLDSEPQAISNEIHNPDYGDLTQYNKNGLIINSISKDVLTDITNDYLSLLETSSAIYEKNGDYALGIFSSGWCRFMDNASNKLCNSKNNTEALKSGKWLCHESCWTEASKKAIETGKKVDIKCNGGLNLYVEPIIASNEVVGAINFGYGNPPTNVTELKQLAEKYQVDYAELSELAKTYESRPLFIVELAKKRLNHSARQIGILIERSQAEEKLKESEEKFRSIVHSSPNGIYFYTLSDNNQLIFKGANPAADKIIGIDHQTLIGKTIDEAFPNLTNTFIPELYTKIANGEIKSNTFEITYNDQQVSGSYLVTAYQSNTGTVVVEFNDISEKIRAERTIIESEEKYRTLIEFAPDAFFQGDNHGNFITINSKACELTGYSKEELISKNMSFLFTEDELNNRPLRYDLLLKGETLTNERKLTCKDGRPIFVEMNSKMLPDGSFQSFIRDITDRKIAEESIRQSEQLFSNIFYNSPVSISITSRDDGKIVDANETFLTGLEYAREEVIGKSIAELGLFYDPNSREKLIEKLIRDGSVTGFECPFKTKTGKKMFGIMSMSFILYKGKPHQLTTVIDITERKIAETKIQNSERLLTESQRVSSIGSYTLNITEGVWAGSQVLDEMFEFSPTDDHSIEAWLAIIHPEDKQMMSDYFALEVIGEKKRFDKIYRIYPLKTKKTRWVHGIGELEFDEEGNPIKMIGTIQDITYRVNTEEKLRILTRAIDQSPDSIVITNTNGEIEYVNPVIEKLSGYTKEELIGENPRIFSSGKTPKEEYKILWDTIISGRSWSGEFQNRKKNGELYWESASISPVLNNEGKITHYLAIREDITDRKKLTQELIEAKEHAEESDRLKTSFLANMSHEIRTPMNSIMGFASLLPEEESRELMVNYAQIIIQNSEQLVSLIDDIVMYSKLQTHLFAFRPKHFLAHDLIIDIHKSFDLPLFQKEVTLKYSCTFCETTYLYSDYDKLRQIITNLISNAFKYTPKGEIVLGCNQKEDFFEFYIKDTGIGIPAKDIDHVFERFFRGSNIDQSTSRGTGLGLCIVKELVEMLGGTIWVESNPDGDRGEKGSTFYFTIPGYRK